MSTSDIINTLFSSPSNLISSPLLNKSGFLIGKNPDPEISFWNTFSFP